MTKLLTPKLDIVFKSLFAGNIEILTDLLNAVLKLPQEQRIRSVEVKNPQILPEEIAQKFIILDILAVDELDQRYDIEMQVDKYVSYPKRTLYYLSKLYAGQLESGEDYEKLRPVIGIHFLDYEEFPKNSDFYFRFELKDIRYPDLKLTDDLALHILELPKFEKIIKADWQSDSLSEWLHFFNHAHEEDKTMRPQYHNHLIHKAFSVLESLSADEKTRHLAEAREKALKNEVSMLGAARREGIAAGRYEKARETAKNLLAIGVLTMEQIVKATGLTYQEIQEIQASEESNR